MFRPPSLRAPQIVPTAANTFAGQPGLLRPGLSCFVTSARTGYANRLTQAIDGAGTFTLSDSQPCRLLTSWKSFAREGVAMDDPDYRQRVAL
jgi:hypothetical protein